MIISSESNRRDTQRYSGVEFRHRPPRPPPPNAPSYRSSTVSTFTQAEQLDRFLGPYFIYLNKYNNNNNIFLNIFFL